MIMSSLKDEKTIPISERLFNFRKKLSLTQKEAGGLFGVQLRAWQDWESGKTIPRRTTLLLLQQYEINPPDIHNIPKMCVALRTKFGLTKTGMAKLFDVLPHTWGYWERGMMKPNYESREKIEKMFAEIEQSEKQENLSSAELNTKEYIQRNSTLV